jgi:hypothetical protein
MYSDRRSFRLADDHLGEAGAHPRHVLVGADLARRRALLRLHPLDQRGFAIADGAADRDIGRAVAAHPRLGEPGEADLENRGRFLRRHHRGNRGRRFCRRHLGLGDIAHGTSPYHGWI